MDQRSRRRPRGGAGGASSVRAIGTLLLLLSCLSAAAPAAARDVPEWLETPEWSIEGRWMAGIGWFGLRTDDPQSVVLDLEYRWSDFWYGVYPLAGALVNTDEAFHLRAGFGRDLEFSGPWDLTISLAAGYWERGESKVLGHEIEFRSALDVTYTMRPDLRVGLTLAHLSNSRLSKTNPGIENLSFTVVYRP